MPQYECDNCGACCQGRLIVEADELDFLREPRLIESDPHWASKPIEQVAEAFREDVGRAIIIACGTDRPCRFLGADNKCTIYPTRPNACVAMEAGDEQCQSARREAGLTPLEPALPSRIIPEFQRDSHAQAWQNNLLDSLDDACS